MSSWESIYAGYWHKLNETEISVWNGELLDGPRAIPDLTTLEIAEGIRSLHASWTKDFPPKVGDLKRQIMQGRMSSADKSFADSEASSNCKYCQGTGAIAVKVIYRTGSTKWKFARIKAHGTVPEGFNNPVDARVFCDCPKGMRYIEHANQDDEYNLKADIKVAAKARLWVDSIPMDFAHPYWCLRKQPTPEGEAYCRSLGFGGKLSTQALIEKIVQIKKGTASAPKSKTPAEAPAPAKRPMLVHKPVRCTKCEQEFEAYLWYVRHKPGGACVNPAELGWTRNKQGRWEGEYTEPSPLGAKTETEVRP